MIQPLRRQHRFMITVLAVILVVLFVAGLLVRRTIPANPYLPEAVLTSPSVRNEQ